MTDLSGTIEPKSDRLNADSLIGRTVNIRVTKVMLSGEPDQPVALSFEGDNGKPFYPCKSMRRVLVQVWGGDGNAYVGRRMTLYRDPEVMFGGMKVGGIRISHMSDIDAPITMALTASKAQRKPFTVKPLPPEQPPAQQKQPASLAERAEMLRKAIADAPVENRRRLWTGARTVVLRSEMEADPVLAASLPEIEALLPAPPTE